MDEDDFEDALNDLIDNAVEEGLSHDKIIGVIEMKLTALKEEQANEADEG